MGPLGSSPTASSTPAQTSAIIPTNESPDVAAFRKELEERMRELPTQNYYEILGVSLKDDGPAISTAFFQLAKRWHPDRLGPEYAHVRDDAMKLFSRMTQAHQTLTDPDQKKQYDEVVREGGGTAEEQEQVQKVMRAVVAYQKAQVLFKKQSMVEAGKLAKQAMDDDPEQAEYTALWVQIEAQDPKRANKGDYQDLIRLMDAAVKKERDNEKVRFARGVVLKKAGRTDDAMKDFKWVARHDPHNLDAIREVRLYAMRSGTDPGGKGKGGMFGKLFKK
jgi:curved DNA-binding protein CbpA